MSEMTYKKILLISLLISILIFSTGCLLDNQEENSGVRGQYSKYYKGTDGVTAEYQNLESVIYYYEDGTEDDNTFNFIVKVQNKGTSLAKGATFISGYDPNIIYIEGQELSHADNTGACSIDISSIGSTFADWAGYISCTYLNGTSFKVQTDEGYWGVDVTNVGSLLKQLGIISSSSAFFENLDLGFFVEDGEGLQTISVDFDSNNLDFEFMYHGNFLAIMLEKSMPFTAGFGREYTLAADNHYYPGGEQNYILYTGKIKNWPRANDEEYPINKLLLTNCYGYATYTSPMVCIDPQPTSDRKKACTPGDIHLTSQGAPIAVTKIEQRNTKKNSIFTIYLKNKGKGEIIYWGDMGRCSPYSNEGILTERNKNVIQGFDVRIEDQSLKCTPKDKKIRLNSQEEVSIQCIYDLNYMNIQSAYQTPLTIEFWYGYMETVSQPVLFKRV